ncbi:MAG TPA: POTRA domain-containing protein, partial [Longimicrobium sp.]|nr:POTRA domain-containing protein [Longimicrobium sp.]
MRIAVVLLALTLLRLPSDGAAFAQASAARAPEVEDVRLEGVRALDERLVRAALVTRESRCRSPFLAIPCLVGIGERTARLDTAEVRRDAGRIDSLYAAWGYPAAEVGSEVVVLADGDVAVVFRVVEGAPLLVRSVEVRGVPAGVDVGALPLTTGEPYALQPLEESQRRIAAALAEEGFAFARVEVGGSVSADQASADVVLEVTPGPPAVFGEPELRVQAPVGERTVRDRLAFRPGEPYRPEALRRTAERLYDIPVVEQVALTPLPSAPGDSVVRVAVGVTRGRLAAVQADFVVSSSSCLGGTFGVAHRHLGGPRVVSVAVGASNLGAREVCAGDEGDAFEEPAGFVRASWREPLAS